MDNKKSPKIVVLKVDLMESDAFLNLSGAAVKVLLFFLKKRQIEKSGKKGHERVIIKNNGIIEFTFREAKNKYKISYPRFSRAIDNLIKNGFLEITKRGTIGRKEANFYFLSERWRKFGTNDFKFIERKKIKHKMGFCEPKK